MPCDAATRLPRVAVKAADRLHRRQSAGSHRLTIEAAERIISARYLAEIRRLHFDRFFNTRKRHGRRGNRARSSEVLELDLQARPHLLGRHNQVPVAINDPRRNRGIEVGVDRNCFRAGHGARCGSSSIAEATLPHFASSRYCSGRSNGSIKGDGRGDPESTQIHFGVYSLPPHRVCARAQQLDTGPCRALPMKISN